MGLGSPAQDKGKENNGLLMWAMFVDWMEACVLSGRDWGQVPHMALTEMVMPFWGEGSYSL